MLQKIKILLVALSTMFVLGAAPVAIATASAVSPTVIADLSQKDINNGLSCGSNGTLSISGTCSNTSSQGNPDSLVKTIINILSLVVGVVAVIMIIVAGLRYVTSGGKDESVKGAKNTILYAVIGLVIVALAQLIVHFVLNNAKTAAGTG